MSSRDVRERPVREHCTGSSSVEMMPPMRGRVDEERRTTPWSLGGPHPRRRPRGGPSVLAVRGAGVVRIRPSKHGNPGERKSNPTLLAGGRAGVRVDAPRFSNSRIEAFFAQGSRMASRRLRLQPRKHAGGDEGAQDVRTSSNFEGGDPTRGPTPP